MAIVTFTTDWGTDDYYAAAAKGILLAENAGITVVDISHHIRPFDHWHARWVLGNSWYLFPEGTVHVIGLQREDVDDGYTIVARYMNHYFIGSNDGLLHLMFGTNPDETYFVLSAQGERVMPGYEVLASAAAFIAGGGKLSDMGTPVKEPVSRTMINPVMEENVIAGTVIYIDRFGNLITNITRQMFDKAAKGRSFEIRLRKREYTVVEISTGYHDVEKANIVVFFNASDNLEIALRGTSADQLLGIKLHDTVRVEFL